MCRGNLQYYGDCGHEKKFDATELCSSYSSNQDKCLGTLTICHQTVIHSPAICVACANRIEMSMILERDHATTAFEKNIATLNHAMRREKDARVYRAITAERAGTMKTMAEYTERKNKELADFQKEQGRTAPGRALDLPYDWWNDEEADPVHVMECGRESCEDENEDRGRLAGPFHGCWNNRIFVQAAGFPRECCKDDNADSCRLLAPFDDGWDEAEEHSYEGCSDEY